MVSNFVQLKEILSDMGIPGAYYKFSERNAPGGFPYYVYFSESTETFKADNISFVNIPTVFIELYTKDKDIVLEKKMESILKENDMPYTKEETFLDDEEGHLVIYTTSFVEE
ncbi:MAG: hypothetical protein KBT03_11870 [Bacteroidales bacterium]|nr:hypothetical protein [Candidatus Scybalousia scybalohippi]